MPQLFVRGAPAALAQHRRAFALPLAPASTAARLWPAAAGAASRQPFGVPPAAASSPPYTSSSSTSSFVLRRLTGAKRGQRSERSAVTCGEPFKRSFESLLASPRPARDRAAELRGELAAATSFLEAYSDARLTSTVRPSGSSLSSSSSSPPPSSLDAFAFESGASDWSAEGELEAVLIAAAGPALAFSSFVGPSSLSADSSILMPSNVEARGQLTAAPLAACFPLACTVWGAAYGGRRSLVSSHRIVTADLRNVDVVTGSSAGRPKTQKEEEEEEKERQELKAANSDNPRENVKDPDHDKVKFTPSEVGGVLDLGKVTANHPLPLADLLGQLGRTLDSAGRPTTLGAVARCTEREVLPVVATEMILRAHDAWNAWELCAADTLDGQGARGARAASPTASLSLWDERSRLLAGRRCERLLNATIGPLVASKLFARARTSEAVSGALTSGSDVRLLKAWRAELRWARDEVMKQVVAASPPQLKAGLEEALAARKGLWRSQLRAARADARARIVSDPAEAIAMLRLGDWLAGARYEVTTETYRPDAYDIAFALTDSSGDRVVSGLRRTAPEANSQRREMTAAACARFVRDVVAPMCTAVGGGGPELLRAERPLPALSSEDAREAAWCFVTGGLASPWARSL